MKKTIQKAFALEGLTIVYSGKQRKFHDQTRWINKNIDLDYDLLKHPAKIVDILCNKGHVFSYRAAIYLSQQQEINICKPKLIRELCHNVLSLCKINYLNDAMIRIEEINNKVVEGHHLLLEELFNMAKNDIFKDLTKDQGNVIGNWAIHLMGESFDEMTDFTWSFNDGELKGFCI